MTSEPPDGLHHFDPDPPDLFGTRRLYVPLRSGAGGVSVSLRLFRDRAEAPCAVGFTTAELLETVLGADQHRYRMTERAVRALARTRGVSRLIVDPGFVGPGGRRMEISGFDDAPAPRDGRPVRRDPAGGAVPGCGAVGRCDGARVHLRWMASR